MAHERAGVSFFLFLLVELPTIVRWSTKVDVVEIGRQLGSCFCFSVGIRAPWHVAVLHGSCCVFSCYQSCCWWCKTVAGKLGQTCSSSARRCIPITVRGLRSPGLLRMAVTGQLLAVGR